MFPRIVLALFTTVWSLLSLRVYAASSNDAFADRVPLTGPGVSAVSSARTATRETGEPNHASSYTNGSLWWSWTAPATGLANFSIFTDGEDYYYYPGSSAAFAIYTGSTLTGLTEVASSNGALTNSTGNPYTSPLPRVTLTVPVVGGQIYQIASASGENFSQRTISTVLNINRAPTILSGAMISGTRGASFLYQIQATEKPVIYSVAGLPAGLSLNPSTGRISGTPAETGVFLIPLEATNPAGSGTATLTLKIDASAPSPAVTPPQFFCAAATTGTVGVSFSFYLNATGTVTTSQASGLPAGLSFDSVNRRILGTPTAAGVFPVNVSATNSAGTTSAVVTILVASSLAPPVLSVNAAAYGTVGSSFYLSISGSNSPTSYAATNLPPGLVLNSQTISGTPTTAGTFTVPVSATNSGGTGTAVLTIVIAPVPPPPAATLQIVSSSTASSVAGIFFTYAIDGGNTATSFTAAGLPPGLSLNPQSGYITGIPTMPGTFAASLTASDGNATVGATVQFTITATAPPAAVSNTIFTSSAGAIGTVGSYFIYSANLSPFAFSTFSATGLPPGLAIESSYGYITGTPTVAGTFPVTLSASTPTGGGNPASKTSAIVTIRILAAPPAPTAAPLITSGASASGIVGASFSYAIAATGSPTGYSASGFPAGLSVNATTGSISGTPTAAGVFPVTLTATNALGSGSATLLLTIAALPAAPVITSYLAASGTVGVSFSSYTIYTTPQSASYTAGPLPPGLSFDSANGTLSGTPTAAGTFSVPISASNASGTINAVLTITIAAVRPAPVIYSAVAAAGTIGSSFSYSISASNSPASYAASHLPDGLGISASTGQISGTPTAAGTFAVELSATNSGGTGTAILTLAIAAAPPIPVIANLAVASATVGTAFSFSITATNSPTLYAASNLPAGLGVNTATGTISGTPTLTGVFSVPISAANSGGTASATLTIKVANPAAPQPPVISSAAAARGLVGAPFTHTLTASNSPASFSATSLPAGLGLNAATGAITGTPTAAGTASVAISATNSTGTTNGILTIDITATPLEPPLITSSAGAIGQVGEPFYHPITASNLPTAFTAAPLPAGLTLDPATGVISGIPSTSAATTVSITASNSAGSSSASLRMNIGTNSVAAARITSASAAAATVGTAFSYTITGTRSPTFFSAPSLPAGLAVNSSTGTISGTPTTAGTSTVTISASGASATLKIIVGSATPAVPIISSAAGMNAYVGDAFGYRILASDTPVSFAATGLPAGLSLNATTGWITGTPTVAGTYNVPLTATNASGAGTASLKIVVASSPLAPRISSSPSAVGTIGTPFVYQFTFTGGFSSLTLSNPLPAGLAYNSSTRQITGTPSFTGFTAVSISAFTSIGTAVGVISITIDSDPRSAPVISSPAAALGYATTDFTYSVSATNQPAAFAAANLPAGLAIHPATGVITGRPTTVGNFAIPLTATNTLGEGHATLTLAVAAAPPAPVMTNAAAIAATLGVKGVIAKITASNSPGQFTASGLPPGLSVDAASGAITGTPTAPGVYAAQISASNAGGTGTATITFTVAPKAVPVFYSDAADSGIVGFSFSGSIYALNSPSSYSATGLPPGLVIDSAYGSISGVPTVAGTFAVQIFASNSGGTTSAIYTIAIAPAPPVTTFSSGEASASGEVGSPFPYYGLSASTSFFSTTVPATFSASGLPPGLNLNATNGNLSGTPTAAGTYAVTVAATNAAGTATAQITIVIAPAIAPVFTSALGATGTLDRAFSHTVAASHTPASFSATGLPPGLTLNPATGTISGSPTATGDYLVSLTATNSAGTGSAQIRLRILATSTAIPVITSAASATVTTSNFSYNDPNAIFSYTIAGAGFPTAFTATNLPPGLSLNPWTGAITGRPAAPGIFQVPISATSAAGTATATLTIVLPVARPAFSLKASVVGYAGVSFSRSVAASASSSSANPFTAPPFPITYSASGLPPGLSLNTSTAQVTGTPALAGTFSATITATNVAGTTNAPLTFLIGNAPPANPASLRFVIAAAVERGALATAFSYDFWLEGLPTDFAASGLPPGLSLSTPNGTYNGVPTKFGRISGTPTMAGTFTVPISTQNAVSSASAVATFLIASGPATPVISSYASRRTYVGAAFSYSIYTASDSNGSDAPITYAAGNLPVGFAFDASRHSIEGVPQTAGTFVIPISATRGGLTGNAVLTLAVDPAPAVSPTGPELSAAAGALGFVGVPFSFPISASGAETLAVSPVPPGLATFIQDGTINGVPAKFATISGFPTSAGTFTIPLSAANASGTSTAVITITIIAPQAALPFITQDPADQTATEGQAIVFTASATGTPPPAFQWFRDGLAIPGATAATLSLPNVTTADAGSYSVIASNPSGTAESASAALTIATSYDSWKNARFTAAEIAAGLADPQADFNADGIANLLEYALLRDPRTGSGGALPLISRTGTGSRLLIQFTRDNSRTDLDYIVEASSDLAEWTPIAISHFGASTLSLNAASTVSESYGASKTVFVEDAQNPVGLPKRFLRLKIARP